MWRCLMPVTMLELFNLILTLVSLLLGCVWRGCLVQCAKISVCEVGLNYGLEPEIHLSFISS